MRKLYERQKYHQKCANAVRRKQVAGWWKEHPDYIKTPSRKARPEGNRTEEKPKPKYTIKQMNVTSKTRLKLRAASGGGFAIAIKAQ